MNNMIRKIIFIPIVINLYLPFYVHHVQTAAAGAIHDHNKVVSFISSKYRSRSDYSCRSSGCSGGSGITISDCNKRIQHQQRRLQQQSSIIRRTRMSILHQSTNMSNDNDSETDNNIPNKKEYFATCIPGLSNILAQELIQIGAKNVHISGPAGVHFTNDYDNEEKEEMEDVGMKAIMYVRTAHRIMELITSSERQEQQYPNENDSFFQDEFDYTSSSSPYSSYFINDRDSLYNFIQNSLSTSESTSNLNIQNLLGNGKGGLFTFNISIIMNNSKYIPKDLCHSHYTSLTVKNAIVDMVRDMRSDGIRPDVDLVDPDVPFMVVVKGIVEGSNSGGGGSGGSGQRRRRTKGRNYDYDDEDDTYYYQQQNQDEKSVHVSLYRILHSGGSSLHRRGYRSTSNAIHKAAMKESLASGLLLQAGWDKLCHAARYNDGLPAVLIDPMCGSGTFCIEGAMIASDYAPGLMRMKCFDSINKNNDNGDGNDNRWNPHQIPPVVRWKNSNRRYWKKLVLEARDRAKSGMEWMKQSNQQYSDIPNCIIMGNEMNPNALDLAFSNTINAGFNNNNNNNNKMIHLHHGDCIDWEVQHSVIPGRTIIVSNPPWGLRLNEDIEESWLSLKSFLRDQCNESEAWVLSGSKSATRYLRMKKTRSTVIKTADEDLRWIQYHIFKKKEKVEEEFSEV